MHTRTAQSNGLVAWAPKRIELFTTPHQQIYSQDWLEQLALHEFRHLVQLDKIQSELPFLNTEITLKRFNGKENLMAYHKNYKEQKRFSRIEEAVQQFYV